MVEEHPSRSIMAAFAINAVEEVLAERKGSSLLSMVAGRSSSDSRYGADVCIEQILEETGRDPVPSPSGTKMQSGAVSPALTASINASLADLSATR